MKAHILETDIAMQEDFSLREEGAGAKFSEQEVEVLVSVSGERKLRSTDISGARFAFSSRAR